MRVSAGWYRLWTTASILILAASIYAGMQNRDAMPEFDGSRCVFGSEQIVTDYDMVRDATPSEVAAEVSNLQNTAGIGALLPDEVVLIARGAAERKIQQSAEYIVCVSIGNIVGQVFWR